MTDQQRAGAATQPTRVQMTDDQAQAVGFVQAGKVGRVARPGRWRVFREGDAIIFETMGDQT